MHFTAERSWSPQVRCARKCASALLHALHWPVAQKLAFVHQLLRHEMAEVRMFLDHIERYAASLKPSDRQSPAVARALDEIVRDHAARSRYLDFARDADEPAIRARMLDVARNLGWLSVGEHTAETLRMINEHLAGSAMGSAEVDLFCSMNKDRELGSEAYRLRVPATHADKVPQAAVLACLGQNESHARMLRAPTSPDEHDVEIAQVYLRHRPITDAAELRVVTSGIARMNGSEAQVRALDTLARQQLTDVASLEELMRLFALAKSVNVQRTIAGILIRADYKSLAKPELVRSPLQNRLKSPEGVDLIDGLIRRLQTH